MRLFKVELDSRFHLSLVIYDGEFCFGLVLFGRGLEIESDGFGGCLTIDNPFN